MGLEQFLHQYAQKNISTPVLFRLNNPDDQDALTKLFKDKNVIKVVDTYTDQLKELYAIDHPNQYFSLDFLSYFKNYCTSRAKNQPLWKEGVWVYFPWNRHLVHILGESEYFRVRTSRNKYLITDDEQQLFGDAHIGIAGLSVGYSILIGLLLEGGGKEIKIADSDVLSLSNTNRVISGIDQLGEEKIDIALQKIYSLNPFAKVSVWRNGLTQDNIADFTDELDIIIDEVDDLRIKYLLRLEAKKRKIPVIMATDNEEMGMIDIERYDTEPELKPFNNRLGNVSSETFSNPNKQKNGALIARYVGKENITNRMMHSLSEIGKSIVSWPQIGGTTMLNGGAIPFIIRNILNKKRMVSQRIIIKKEN